MNNSNSYGFIKLCYGVVGSYKDTSKMTTRQVIEEFLRHEGVSSAKEYFDKAENNTYGKLKQDILTKQKVRGIIETGAEMGAYDDNNDPDGHKRENHAITYYDSVRNSNKDDIIMSISKNANVDKTLVTKMFNHLFVNKYQLEKGFTTFDASYDISESIRRLREGKNIQLHDIILIYHESYEHDLMNYSKKSYEEAHKLTNKKYNYEKALNMWKEKR